MTEPKNFFSKVPIEIEHGDQKHQGTFQIGPGKITVTWGDQSTATDYKFSERPVPLAQTILKEMVTGLGQLQKRANYVQLRIYSVEEYWTTIVVPNIQECMKDPNSRTIFNAGLATWHMIDWAWHETNYGRDTRGNPEYVEYKKRLLTTCPALEWLGDIAEAWKHCGLGRETASAGLVPLTLVV